MAMKGSKKGTRAGVNVKAVAQSFILCHIRHPSSYRKIVLCMCRSFVRSFAMQNRYSEKIHPVGQYAPGHSDS